MKDALSLNFIKDLNKKDENSKNCSICLDNLEAKPFYPVGKSCAHVLHKTCLCNYLKSQIE